MLLVEKLKGELDAVRLALVNIAKNPSAQKVERHVGKYGDANSDFMAITDSDGRSMLSVNFQERHQEQDGFTVSHNIPGGGPENNLSQFSCKPDGTMVHAQACGFAIDLRSDLHPLFDNLKRWNLFLKNIQPDGTLSSDVSLRLLYDPDGNVSKVTISWPNIIKGSIMFSYENGAFVASEMAHRTIAYTPWLSMRKVSSPKWPKERFKFSFANDGQVELKFSVFGSISARETMKEPYTGSFLFPLVLEDTKEAIALLEAFGLEMAEFVKVLQSEDYLSKATIKEVLPSKCYD